MNVTKKKLLAQTVKLGEKIALRESWAAAQKEFNKLIEIIWAIESDDDLRAEITGRSTYSSSGSFGNTGYSGGCTQAAA